MTDEAAILRQAKLRVTVGRKALIQALMEHAEPVSMDDAVNLCGDKGGDPATIYRNLQALCEAGILRPVRGVGRREMYELAIEHGHSHAHVSCTRCGKVECIEIEHMPAHPGAPGWQLDDVSLTAWGVCPECAT
jgi:Fe2+ or Zn2+ uptake regulation protein